MASVPLNARNNSYDVHQHLRRLIMTGQLAPGAIISQAGVARDIGVSRTPVREAMRMLQNEGLLLAEPNNRARVTGFSAGELEATYFSRILLESADFDVWVLAHRDFHRLLVAPAGRDIEIRILSLLEQSTRFQYMLNSTREPNWWVQRGDEHARLLDACQRADAAGGARLMATHLAQSALIILEDFAKDGATTGASILLARDMVMGG
jgi:DNA-binding GntR family transcriptional regulator